MTRPKTMVPLQSNLLKCGKLVVAVLFLYGALWGGAESRTQFQLEREMESGVAAPRGLLDVIGAPPVIGGRCPSILDKIWKIPEALVNECVTPDLVKTLGKCGKAIELNQGIGTMSNTLDCISTLNKKVDFSSAVSRLDAALPTALTCLTKTALIFSDASGPQKASARKLIDNIKWTYGQLKAVRSLATNLVTIGPSGIPQLFTAGVGDHDYDSTDISLGDLLVEADKYAKDPGSYLASKAKIDKSAWPHLFDFIHDREKFSENFNEYTTASTSNSRLDQADSKLEKCNTDESAAMYQSYDDAMLQVIKTVRTNMEYYRQLTMCNLPIHFDRLSPGAQQNVLYGDNAQTGYEQWKHHEQHYNYWIERYKTSHARNQVFKTALKKKQAELAPFLEEAKALEIDIRKRASGCIVAGTGGENENSPEQLEYRVTHLKARLLNHAGPRCSIEMANSIVAKALHEAEQPDQHLKDFLIKASRLINGDPASCQPENVQIIMKAYDKLLDDAYLSPEDRLQCLRGDERALMVKLDIFRDNIKLIDESLITAGDLLKKCKLDNLESILDQVMQWIDELPCAHAFDEKVDADGSGVIDLSKVHLGNPGKDIRLKLIETIRADLQKSDCSIAEISPKNQIVVRVIGNGYVPHYGGGSHIVAGHKDALIHFEEEPTKTQVDTMLRNIHEQYDVDPCTATMPPIPGLTLLPVIYSSGPKIEVVEGPENFENDNSLILENTRARVGEVKKTLGDLKADACQ